MSLARKNYSTTLFDHSFDALEVTEADMLDAWCDPAKPYNLQFEEIAAAANRIKNGVEQTPCSVIAHDFHLFTASNSIQFAF